IESGTKITQLESDFDYHFADNEILDITRLSGELEGAQWQASGRLNDLSSPGIEMTFSGNIDAGNLVEFANLQEQMNASGNLNFKGHVGGHLPHWKFNKNKTKLNAELNWGEGSFTWLGTDHQVDNIEGEFMFQDDQVEIKKLSATMKSSDFNIHGSINHVISSNGNDQVPLVLDVDLLSQHIHLADLYNSAEKTASSGSFGFPKGVVLTGDLAVNSFTHQNFVAQELKGKIDFRDGVISGKQLALKTASGSAKSDLTFSQLSDGFYLQSNSQLSGLRIEELFLEFDDFGQEFITSKHLKGVCNSNTTLSASFSRELDLDPNSIIAKVDLTINNGELTSLESMTEICAYLKEKHLISSVVDAGALEKTLDHIQFEELSNTVQIENGVISIPKMDVYSSALDINIKGSHSFDNEIDYSLGFYLRDLLYDKSKSEFGEVEDDGLGNHFFLSMKGTTDNPEFGYDRLAHREQRKEDFQKEKNTLKSIIKEDLNPFKKKDKKTVDEKPNTSKEDDGEIKVSIQVEDEEPEEKKGLRDLFKKKKKESEKIDLEDDDF
ncbi:MAG: AsmA-like C-terminal region-containing protein, partial [Flavobacteriales bacterium]